MINNLLETSKVSDLFLQSILSQARSKLTIFSSSVKLQGVRTFGKVLAAVDGVSTIVFDLDTKEPLRCPAIGELIYVENVGSKNYNLYYSVEKGRIVVDSIRGGRYEARRDLFCASKNPIKYISTTDTYVLIVDHANDVEIVNKKDVFVNSVSHSLKSRSFIFSRSQLFGALSRMFSGTFEAGVFTNGNMLTMLVVGGGSKTLYQIDIDPNSMIVTSGAMKLTKLSKANQYSLQAMFDFNRYAAKRMLSYDNITILSAFNDGRQSVVSFYNKENKNYEQVVLQDNNGIIEEAFKSTTEKAFKASKIISLQYPSEVKQLLLDVDPRGTSVKYIVMDSSLEQVASGSSKTTGMDASILLTTQSVELEEAVSAVSAVEEDSIE